MENIETQCLEKLNNILSKFNLQIVIIKVNQLNQRQHRLIYKNDTANWIALWLSISEILFAHTTSKYMADSSIFDRLKTYYNTMSNSSVNRLAMSKETLFKFQDCSDAYKEIASLKSGSFEEFIIKCDLIGI